MGVGAGLYMYDVVVKKFTFAISSPDEFLSSKLPTLSPDSGLRRFWVFSLFTGVVSPCQPIALNGRLRWQH